MGLSDGEPPEKYWFLYSKWRDCLTGNHLKSTDFYIVNEEIVWRENYLFLYSAIITYNVILIYILTRITRAARARARVHEISLARARARARAASRTRSRQRNFPGNPWQI